MRRRDLLTAIYLVVFVPIILASELHPGDSIDKSLRPGATETYAVNLQAGDVVSLKFADTGQDIILTVQTPGGEVARRFSSKLQGAQPIAWYSAESGAWQIALTGRDKGAECGYKLSDLKISKSDTLLKPSAEIESPRLKQLTDSAAVAKFWAQIGKEGTPLIESLPDDPRNMLATFVWRARGETKGAMVQAQFCAEDNCLMRRLRDSDLWYVSLKINRHVRTYYSIATDISSVPKSAGDYGLVDALSQRDPLNPKGWFERDEDPDIPAHHGVSRLEVPDAPAQPWADKRKDVLEGQVEKHAFKSALLKNTRDVWVYTPSRLFENGHAVCITVGLRRGYLH